MLLSTSGKSSVTIYKTQKTENSISAITLMSMSFLRRNLALRKHKNNKKFYNPVIVGLVHYTYVNIYS